MYVIACVCFIWCVKRMCVGCFWTLCLSECSLYFKGRGRLCNFKMCVCVGVHSTVGLRSADNEICHTHTDFVQCADL